MSYEKQKIILKRRENKKVRRRKKLTDDTIEAAISGEKNSKLETENIGGNDTLKPSRSSNGRKAQC